MSGIVRKIDELGRIVIPKEIRRVLKIKVGTPMEITADGESKLVLTKFNTLSKMFSELNGLVLALSNSLNAGVILTDNERQVLASKIEFKQEYTITKKLERIMEARKLEMLNNLTLRELFLNLESGEVFESILIMPLLSESSVVGSILVINCEDKEYAGKLLKFISNVIK